jgi:hypothetical protein
LFSACCSKKINPLPLKVKAKLTVRRIIMFTHLLTHPFIAYGFGFIVVFMFCVRYFNEPKYKVVDTKLVKGSDKDRLVEPVCPRFMTNRYIYRYYLILFIAFTELLYIIVANLLPDLTGKDTAGYYNAFASALILTGFLPSLPYIRRLMDKTKFIIHDKARIPDSGQNFYHFLRTNPIRYPEPAVEELIEDKVYGKGLELGNFASDDDTVEARWAKISYLLFHVDKWSKFAPFRASLRKREMHWPSIQSSYLTLQESWEGFRSGKLSEDQQNLFENNLRELLFETYRLLACTLFDAERPSKDINIYTQELGYGAYSEQLFFPSNRKVALYAISTFIGILIGAAATGLIARFLSPEFSWLKITISADQIVTWVLFGVPFFLLPVLFILTVKWYFSFSETLWPMVSPHRPYKKLSERPWGVYVFVSVFACIVGTLTLVVVGTLYGHIKWSEIFEFDTYRQMGKWSLVILVTAGFVTYRIDSLVSRNKLKNIILTCSGALSQGMLSSLAIFFSFMWYFNEGSFDLTRLNGERPGQLFCYLLLAFIIGNLLFLTSRFNRRILERREYERRKAKAVSVELESGGKTYPGSLINASKRGALLQTDMPAHFREVVNIIMKKETPKAGIVVSAKGDLIHLQLKTYDLWYSLVDGNLLAEPST